MKPDRRVPFAVLLGGAAALALALRLLHLGFLSGSPFASALMGDSLVYDTWARQIAGGDWLGKEIFYQAPLYPYSLAIVFRLLGHSLDSIRIIQSVVGAVSCALLGMAGRRFFNDRVGILASGLLAIYPAAIFFDGLIQKSSLDIFFVALSLALLGEFEARRTWRWLAAAGVVAAALTLNRENARVLYPVVAAWLLFGFRDVPVRRRFWWTGSFLAASLVVLLPVGLRNARVGGEFLLSTSQFGPNFYIGNRTNASGSYEALAGDRGDAEVEREDATRLASEASGRALSPSGVSNYWFGRALADIRSHPGSWLALMAKKALLSVNAAELPDTESLEAHADYSWVLRALRWLNLGVVLPLAILGAWTWRKEWRRLLILHALLAGLLLSVVLFYVVARYRHPAVPIALLFAAAGIASLVAIVAERRANRKGRAKSRGTPRRAARAGMEHGTAEGGTGWWLPGLGAAAVMAIVANVPMHVVHDKTYLNLGMLMLRGERPAEAVRFLLKATASDPTDSAAHASLAVAYHQMGQPESERQELAEAIRLRPDFAEAHSALGMLLRSEGKLAAAVEQFTEAARLAPESVEIHSNLGLALTEIGRPREAIPEHRRAVALAPSTAAPHNNLGVALQQAGDGKGAIVEFLNAIAIDSEYGEAHANLATSLADAGELADAFRHFDDAVRLMPDNPNVRLAFGKWLCESGRIEDGLSQYRDAAGLSPDSAGILYLAASAYARAGRPGVALPLLERALTAATSAGEPEAIAEIGRALGQVRRLMGR